MDYDFARLKKIEKAAKRYDKKIDKRRKKLRSSLEKGKRMHLLSGRLEKDAPVVFYKSTTNQKSFFNKYKELIVMHRFVNYNGINLYRVQEVNSGREVEGKFLRKELFTLENNVM